MVKASFKYSALALFLLTLLLLSGGVWLFGTTAGTRALLAFVSSSSPLKIEVAAISGRLADELTLDGVRLRWPGGEAAIPTLRLHWQPWQLLRGQLAIQELNLGKMEIQLQDDTTAKPTPPLRWPLVSGIPRRLDGAIAAVQLAGVELHRPAAEPLLLGQTTLRLDWQDGVLSLSQLQSQTPYGSVAGEVAAGLVTPTLTAQLHGELSTHQRFQLHLNLATASNGELLSGPLQLDLSTDKEGTLHLGGELGVAATGAELRQLLGTRSSAAGEVRGKLSYRFDGGPRSLALQLLLADIDLIPETGIATALSGRIEIKGGPDAYDGEFDLKNSGKDWRDLGLAGHLAGNRQSIALSEITGQLLAGQLGGAIHLDWSGPLALNATLQGKNLNPGIVSPPLAGKINFDLTSTLLLPPEAPPQLELVARLHASSLRGHPISGEIDASWNKGDLRLRRLELHGDGIDLTAKGQLQKRVDFTVAIQRLEGLLPAAGGGGSAAGWLRWQGGDLVSGAIAGEGKMLSYAGLSIGKGALRLQRPTPRSAITFRADLRTIRYQDRRFDRLELQGDGVVDKHQIRLALTWPQGEVRVEGTGSYQAGNWSGKILRLQGEEQAVGGWHLVAPVTLLAGNESVRLSPLKLTSTGGERFELAGAYDRATGTGEVSAQWDDLALQRLKPWLPPTLAVAGKLSGGLTATIHSGGILDLAGKAEVNAGSITWFHPKGKTTLALRNAKANCRWQEKALVLDLALVLADYGQLTANVSLPIPALLPIAIVPAGALTGAITGNLKEQGLLAAFLPGVLRESHGELKIDLKLGGSWQNPTFAGGLGMTGAGAYLPQAGIEIRDLTLRADFAGDRLRIVALEFWSGAGKVKGEGEVRLQNWQVNEFHGTLGGENFLAINLPELRLIVSPALTVSGSADHLQLRGEVKLPELLVRGRQSAAPLRQSADVIILDAVTESSPSPPLALDIEVRIILGDRVLVNFGGIDASLAGNVLLNARNLAEIKGRGEIHVVKGSYAAYGMKLKVEHGTLLFAGGAIEQPTLDILALRQAGEVKAGVLVSGTPRTPVIKLYSEPSMPDTDILSYIVLGRPMGSDSGQADLLLIAAGALLAKGESTVLQDRLRRRVGLDVLDIQAGNGDVTTSMITIGKYLNPKLYVSLGHSLFTGSNVVGLRYTLGRRWQAESTVGVESGIDLFYTVEFR